MRSIGVIVQGIQEKVKALQAENAISLESVVVPDNDKVDDVIDATWQIIHHRDIPKETRGLMPVYHPNRNFFLCDLLGYAHKDDNASMDAPFFTLSTKPDLSIFTWESKDGKKKLKVTPSVAGRATQFDKDVLIYVVSQITEGLNRKRDDTKNRTVRFQTSRTFFKNIT